MFVVLAGGLMPVSTTAQIIGPLSDTRRVIAIDLEGHGRTGLRDTPLSHERNGDDAAAVLRHLGIAEANIAGYSYGGVAAIGMAIGHPKMVRILIVISTGFASEGWYPEDAGRQERSRRMPRRANEGDTDLRGLRSS